MEILKLKTMIDPQGRLCMDVPTSLKPGAVDVVMVLQPEANNSVFRSYDFSDLVGKLKWPGDTLACQKEIRNEW